MVQDNDAETWFKMQVWVLQFLIRDFKESDGDIIDVDDPEVFKASLFEDGWVADSKHVQLFLSLLFSFMRSSSTIWSRPRLT